VSPPPDADRDVRGTVDPRFARAREAFARLVAPGRGGGALVVRLRGETVLELCTGWADRAQTRPWNPDTLGLSFSTTKGVASTVVHRLAERGELAYDEPVASYWPEFAAGGKDRVTVRDLLTHRAGLWSVRAVAERPEDLLDHHAMEERLAARTVRAPTERSAYHAITYGWLVAGLVRRVSGGRGPRRARADGGRRAAGHRRPAHRRARDRSASSSRSRSARRCGTSAPRRGSSRRSSPASSRRARRTTR
jgi:CubicO group peptidase (beta-lactamase class C family)